MGKKSLIKSTSKKKKAASKKKDDDKKTSVPETAKKVAPGKKAAAKKSAPEKPTAQKKAAPKTDSASKELLFRKFEKEAPAELFKIEPAKGDFAAPPLISTTDKMETERLKAILFRKFDLAEPSEEKPTVEKSTEPAGKKEVSAAEKKTEKPVEKKKVEKPDPREVIARKFFQAPPSDSLFVPQTRKEAVPSAPPLISAADDEEAAWLKKLLFRQIDLTTPVEKRKPAPEAEPETPAEAKAKEKIEEPAEEAAPVPEEAKEPPDPREVIARKFFQAPPADSLFVPQTRKEAVPSAPPPFRAADPEGGCPLRPAFDFGRGRGRGRLAEEAALQANRPDHSRREKETGSRSRIYCGAAKRSPRGARKRGKDRNACRRARNRGASARGGGSRGRRTHENPGGCRAGKGRSSGRKSQSHSII